MTEGVTRQEWAGFEEICLPCLGKHSAKTLYSGRPLPNPTVVSGQWFKEGAVQLDGRKEPGEHGPRWSFVSLVVAPST